jgi:hypothetical protein
MIRIYFNICVHAAFVVELMRRSHVSYILLLSNDILILSDDRCDLSHRQEFSPTPWLHQKNLDRQPDVVSGLCMWLEWSCIYFPKPCVDSQGPKYIGNHDGILASYALQYFMHILLCSLIATKYATLTMTIILSTYAVGSLKVSTNASILSLTHQGRDLMHFSTFQRVFWLSRTSLNEVRSVIWQ